MHNFLLIFALLGVPRASFGAERKPCVCTCIIKKEDGKYGTLSGKGIDREAAGESLKKNLEGKKCEVSPDCEGSCRPDED